MPRIAHLFVTSNGALPEKKSLFGVKALFHLLPHSALVRSHCVSNHSLVRPERPGLPGSVTYIRKRISRLSLGATLICHSANWPSILSCGRSKNRYTSSTFYLS